MYYRRKIILALLEQFGGELEKISLQKLLFIFSRRQEKAVYDFIPYKFGCYSYTAGVDLGTMVSKDFLSESEKSFSKKDSTDYFTQLTSSDKALLLELKTQFGKMNANALMKYTYLNYPFYAIHSQVAASILSEAEYDKVKQSKAQIDKTILFTIGYEGISLEEYLNRLLRNDVKVLVDVRNSPLSMKYGFSKTLLKRYCESVGIQYMHFPEVGIHSDKRQELNTQDDYDRLFSNYRKTNLIQTVSTQLDIFEVLKKYHRIALTCFESNICQCHRKSLSEAISLLPGFEFELKHI